MENIRDKLREVHNMSDWNNWSLEEQQQLLDIYFIISKKEPIIFDLIYNYHDCDSWEDIFRDYKLRYLREKAEGVKIALDEVTRQIEDRKNHK